MDAIRTIGGWIGTTGSLADKVPLKAAAFILVVAALLGGWLVLHSESKTITLAVVDESGRPVDHAAGTRLPPRAGSVRSLPRRRPRDRARTVRCVDRSEARRGLNAARRWHSRRSAQRSQCRSTPLAIGHAWQLSSCASMPRCWARNQPTEGRGARRHAGMGGLFVPVRARARPRAGRRARP